MSYFNFWHKAIFVFNIFFLALYFRFCHNCSVIRTLTMEKTVSKRQPYQYKFNGTVIKSWRKLYMIRGEYFHKKSADDIRGWEPISPTLALSIFLAKTNNNGHMATT